MNTVKKSPAVVSGYLIPLFVPVRKSMLSCCLVAVAGSFGGLEEGPGAVGGLERSLGIWRWSLKCVSSTNRPGNTASMWH